jgi:hypothetical protein
MAGLTMPLLEEEQPDRRRSQYQRWHGNRSNLVCSSACTLLTEGSWCDKLLDAPWIIAGREGHAARLGKRQATSSEIMKNALAYPRDLGGAFAHI